NRFVDEARGGRMAPEGRGLPRGLAACLLWDGPDRGRTLAGLTALLNRRGRPGRAHRIETRPQRRLRLWADEAIHAPPVSTEHAERRPGPHREAPIDSPEALALVVGVDDHDRHGLFEVPLEVGNHRDHPKTLHASPIEEGYEDGPATGHCCVECG